MTRAAIGKVASVLYERLLYLFTQVFGCLLRIVQPGMKKSNYISPIVPERSAVNLGRALELTGLTD